MPPVLCDVCQADISTAVRIHCTECINVQICVACFAAGRATDPHSPEHAYVVVRKLLFPVFTADWAADEELLLLEGLSSFGMGNWAAVSDHVGTKSKEECERHYVSIYCDSPRWPLPVEVTLEEGALKAAMPERSKRHHLGDQETARAVQSHPHNHEIQGYMPGRQEFETEFENEAENVIKDMSFAQGEAEDELELKLTLLDMYNRLIDKRKKRRKFIIDRGLTDYRKNQTLERKLDREERELLTQIKVFSRLITQEDFDQFAESIMEEKKLRKQARVFQEYRLNGIRTLREGAEFEEARMKRMTVPSYAAMTRDSQATFDRMQRLQGHARVPSHNEASPAPVDKKGGGGRRAAPLDISEAEDIQLLTEAEIELCSTLRIYPRPYLVVKETFLHSYARKGTLRRREAREMLKIDVNKSSQIYNFLAKMGWIKTLDNTARANRGGRMLAPAQTAQSNAQPDEIMDGYNMMDDYM